MLSLQLPPWTVSVEGAFPLGQALGAVVNLVAKLAIGTLVLTHGCNARESRSWKARHKIRLRQIVGSSRT